MKQLRLFKTMLLMCLFLSGISNAWGEEVVKCTAESDLKAGEVYYISGATSYSGDATVMGKSTGGNNFPATTFNNAPCELTLGGDAINGWYFSYVDGGTTYYLDPTSITGSNYLKRNTELTQYGKFSISITNDDEHYAVITSKGKSSRHIIRYNSSSNCYSCYSFGQGAVCLYKKSSDSTTPNYYSITVVNDIANGTVTASTESATAGTEITLTAAPADGYKFGSWNVTNATTSEAITVTDNKFTMPSADVNVSASFVMKRILHLTDEDLSIDDITDEIYDEVIVDRPISAGKWSTLCLPFDMSESQINKNFGSDAKIVELTGFKRGLVDVSETEKAEGLVMCFTEPNPKVIHRGTPCMVKITEYKPSITVSDVMVNTTAPTKDIIAWNADDSNYVVYHGDYLKRTIDPNDGNFIIASNKYNYVIEKQNPEDEGVVNYGFRGYFHIPGVARTTPLGAVYFDDPLEYNVSVTTSTSAGSISASSTQASKGETVTLTATPAMGYEFVSWNVTYAPTGESIEVIDNTFTMPAANVNVSAEFRDVQSEEETTVAWVASEQGYTNGVQYTSATVDSNISLSFGDSGNDGKYYDTGEGIRIYSNGKITVSAADGCTMSKIVITYSGTSYTGTFSASIGDYSLSSTTGTWTGSASSVVFTNTATSGHARVQKIEVTYANGSEILTTLKAVYDKAKEVGTTPAYVKVKCEDWIVTGVQKGRVYLTDGANGAVILNNNHGFEAGDILNGTVTTELMLYNGAAQFNTLISSTPGLDVRSGGSVGPISIQTGDLNGSYTGVLLKYENMTYNGTLKSLTDGTNTITPYNGLYDYGTTFEDGKKYHVTGVYVLYYQDNLNEILPRSTDDIVEVQNGGSTEYIYTLVSDINSLQAGDKIIFACNNKDVVAGQLVNTYLEKLDANFNDDKTICYPTNPPLELIVGKEAQYFTFTDTQGKLLASTSVKTMSWDNTLSDNSKWEIKIVNDMQELTCVAREGYIRYNNTSPRFSTYTGSGSKVQLYKKEISVVTNNVATPTFSPNGGIYYEPQYVNINCSTPDAIIYYTVDGKEPTTSSTQYNGIPIAISSTTTIKAIAVKNGMDDSDVATATFTIRIPSSAKQYAIVGKMADQYYAVKITGAINSPNKKMATVPVTISADGKVVYSNIEDITWTWDGQYIESTNGKLAAHKTTETYIGYEYSANQWDENDDFGIVNSIGGNKALLISNVKYNANQENEVEEIVAGYYATSNIDKSNFSSILQFMPIESVNNPQCAVNWSVNGNITKAEQQNQGDVLSFPDIPDDINGYTFINWTCDTSVNPDGTQINYILQGAKVPVSDEVTYYAVFAKPSRKGGETVKTITLTNANIVQAGAPNTGYANWELKDNDQNTWSAYAIKNHHSNTTKEHHYLQIKKPATENPSYIQLPILDGNIKKVSMTVSRYDKPMDGGENSSTLYLSTDKTTTSQIGSATDPSFVEITPNENVSTAYIVAGAAVRIWDCTIEYQSQGDEVAYSNYCLIVPDVVQVVIGSSCYSTLYYGDRNLMVPAGLNVRTFSYDEGKNQLKILHSYEEGQIIEQGTGVLLKANEPGTYVFEVTQESGLDKTGLCMFGVDEVPEGDITEPGCRFYVFNSSGSNGAGFYWGNADGTGISHSKIRDHKAYIKVPTPQNGAHISFFSLEDVETGIDMIRDVECDMPIYTIDGRRVNNANRPGVYIQNGRKFIVK